MNRFDLAYAMNEIDEEYLAEAEESGNGGRPGRPSGRLRALPGIFAAAAAVLFISGGILRGVSMNDVSLRKDAAVEEAQPAAAGEAAEEDMQAAAEEYVQPAAAGEAAEEDVLYEETAGETADGAAPDVTEEPVPEEDAALYDAENAEQAREAAEEPADAGRSPYAALTLVLFAAGVVLLIAAAVLFMKNRRR